eukprot:GHVN01069445.1.p1 GENE.GHVN01069445.1~~GHVN01069445.1.p1  ORF type:complete len:805 (+),score=53.69 GHVN01069445.1:194-2608(+)
MRNALADESMEPATKKQRLKKADRRDVSTHQIFGKSSLIIVPASPESGEGSSPTSDFRSPQKDVRGAYSEPTEESDPTQRHGSKRSVSPLSPLGPEISDPRSEISLTGLSPLTLTIQSSVDYGSGEDCERRSRKGASSGATQSPTSQGSSRGRFRTTRMHGGSDMGSSPFPFQDAYRQNDYPSSSAFYNSRETRRAQNHPQGIGSPGERQRWPTSEMYGGNQIQYRDLTGQHIVRTGGDIEPLSPSSRGDGRRTPRSIGDECYIDGERVAKFSHRGRDGKERFETPPNGGFGKGFLDAHMGPLQGEPAGCSPRSHQQVHRRRTPCPPAAQSPSSRGKGEMSKMPSTPPGYSSRNDSRRHLRTSGDFRDKFGSDWRRLSQSLAGNDSQLCGGQDEKFSAERNYHGGYSEGYRSVSSSPARHSSRYNLSLCDPDHLREGEGRRRGYPRNHSPHTYGTTYSSGEDRWEMGTERDFSGTSRSFRQKRDRFPTLTMESDPVSGDIPRHIKHLTSEPRRSPPRARPQDVADNPDIESLNSRTLKCSTETLTCKPHSASQSPANGEKTHPPTSPSAPSQDTAESTPSTRQFGKRNGTIATERGCDKDTPTAGASSKESGETHSDAITRCPVGQSDLTAPPQREPPLKVVKHQPSTTPNHESFATSPNGVRPSMWFDKASFMRAGRKITDSPYPPIPSHGGPWRGIFPNPNMSPMLRHSVAAPLPSSHTIPNLCLTAPLLVWIAVVFSFTYPHFALASSGCWPFSIPHVPSFATIWRGANGRAGLRQREHAFPHPFDRSGVCEYALTYPKQL